MNGRQNFDALVVEFYQTTLGQIGVSLPDIPRAMAGEMALYFAYEYDLQIRLARTFGRSDLPVDSPTVHLVLKGDEDRFVRFWYDADAKAVHAEPAVADPAKATRSSLALKPEHPLGPEHYKNIACAGVRMLIDNFGATYGSEIEVVAPLAPDFDEAAVMSLLNGQIRPDPDDGYQPGEECDPDFTALYDEIQTVLRPVAEESPFPGGDYFLVDYDNGRRQQKIEIEKYALLHPHIIGALRRLLDRFPRWEIVIGLGEEGWPPMGLTVRKHEIIDGLLPEYLPPECRAYQYEDARVGTEND